MKSGQVLRYAENQNVTWQVIEMPEELSEQQDDGDFGIWICLIATTLVAILTQHPNYSLQEKTLRLIRPKTALETEGREIIGKSIRLGNIGNTTGEPFRNLRLEKKQRRMTGNDKHTTNED